MSKFLFENRVIAASSPSPCSLHVNIRIELWISEVLSLGLVSLCFLTRDLGSPSAKEALPILHASSEEQIFLANI